MLPLTSLGDRIAILGPSNSGKSTLAVSIGKKSRYPVVHLDQLRHIPHTNWRERSDEEFVRLHDTAILGDCWVLEGNYSSLLPQRFDRATGIIVLNSSLYLRCFRYLKRTMRKNSERAGHLDGVQDRISWKMIKWIITTRDKGYRYAQLARSTNKPSIECHTARELNELYRYWDLPLH